MPRKPTGKPNGRPKKKRWIEDYASIGLPPEDPILAMEWGFKALMVSLQKTIADPDMNEQVRSHQIRQHLRSAKDMIPKARLAELERRLDAFERRDQGGAQTLDEAPTVDDAAPESDVPIGIDYRALRTGRT
jgi:hypothetical protein